MMIRFLTKRLRASSTKVTATAHNTASGGGKAPAIAVFVFGKRGYYVSAESLALSIRANCPGINVHLWAADPEQVDHSIFASVTKLDHQVFDNGPGSLKTSIYSMLPDGEWLVMDADMVVIKDLSPYIAQLRGHDFAMEYNGKGSSDADLGYFPWATTDTIKRVASLPDETTFHGVQSSWMWIRKPSAAAKAIFDKARTYPFKITDLKERWGFDIPDELRFATAIAELKVDIPDIKLSFYGGLQPYGWSGIKEPVLCLYGDNKRHSLVRPSWLAIYDTYVRQLYTQTGRLYAYPLRRVMQDKYVNQ